MLARRLPGLLPPLDADECIEVTRVHSAAGLLAGRGLVRERPFRAPHHTASDAAMCGGGARPRPGEVTLAHRGVLFLDEFPEFSRRALESLREPLEAGEIHVARAAMSLCFPARVLLVAAMNPCPCGNFDVTRPAAVPQPVRITASSSGGPGALAASGLWWRAGVGSGAAGVGGGAAGSLCLCSFEQLQRYRARISGPLLDRIDLHVAVAAVPYRDYARSQPGETTAVVRERVRAARERQTARLGPGRANACLTDAELRELVPLHGEALRLIEAAIDEQGLSTRAIGRVLKVARTVADLASEPLVAAEHVREALGLRLLDYTGAQPAKGSEAA